MKKILVLYNKCTDDYIVNELKTIRMYRSNLRSNENIYKRDKNVYDCSDYYWRKKGCNYRKIYHINSMYKFLNKHANMRFIGDFSIDRFMKVVWLKAIDLQHGIKCYDYGLKKTKTSARDREKFLKQRTMQNTLTNMRKFVYNFTREKYYIIYLLEEKNIPNDIIKILFDYIYYNGGYKTLE